MAKTVPLYCVSTAFVAKQCLSLRPRRSWDELTYALRYGKELCVVRTCPVSGTHRLRGFLQKRRSIVWMAAGGQPDNLGFVPGEQLYAEPVEQVSTAPLLTAPGGVGRGVRRWPAG